MQAQAPLKKVYNEEINPVEQLGQAIATAHSEGKFVVAQLGGNWCPWCLKFAAFVEADEEINALVRDNFVYVHLNYHPRRSHSEALAQQTARLLDMLGRPQRFGFPVFVVLDGEGRIVHTQDSALLEEGNGYNREKVLRFFQNWTPAALRP